MPPSGPLMGPPSFVAAFRSEQASKAELRIDPRG